MLPVRSQGNNRGCSRHVKCIPAALVLVLPKPTLRRRRLCMAQSGGLPPRSRRLFPGQMQRAAYLPPRHSPQQSLHPGVIWLADPELVFRDSRQSALQVSFSVRWPVHWVGQNLPLSCLDVAASFSKTRATRCSQRQWRGQGSEWPASFSRQSLRAVGRWSLSPRSRSKKPPNCRMPPRYRQGGIAIAIPTEGLSRAGSGRPNLISLHRD